MRKISMQENRLKFITCEPNMYALLPVAMIIAINAHTDWHMAV